MVDINAAFDALEEGRFDEAKRISQAAILEDPTLPAPHYLLGTLHGLQDRIEEAIACLERARSFAPNHVATNINLANLLKRAGKPQQAFDVLSMLEQSTDLDAEALALKANLQLELKETKAAIHTANLALAQQSECISALVAKANGLAALGRHEDALSLYSKAIALDPSPQLSINKARVFQECGKLQEALELYDSVLKTDSAQIESLTGKAQVFCELDRPEEAKLAAQTALNLLPTSREAKFMLASALHKNDQNEEARLILEELLSEKKEARMLVVYAQVLSDLFMHETAMDACTQALELSEEFHEAYLQRGLIRLLTQDLKGGFEDYEYRLLVPYNIRTTLKTQAHLAQAAARNLHIEDLRGKRTVILEEQGLGDIIMFSSLLPDLLQYKVHFEVVVQKRIINLLQRSFPTIKFYELERFSKEDAAQYDLVMMIGSLGHLFRKEKWQQNKTSFLIPDPQKVADWKKRMNPLEGKKIVGISWKGGTIGTHVKRRTIPLSQFEPILKNNNIHFVSLQPVDRNETADEFARLNANISQFREEELWDIDDLAALICATDGIITVQNTNAHLCGALGKQAIVLIPTIPEWRYGSSGDQLLWYSSPRLFRRNSSAQIDWNLVDNSLAKKYWGFSVTSCA